jgi:hypothetical protein
VDTSSPDSHQGRCLHNGYVCKWPKPGHRNKALPWQLNPDPSWRHIYHEASNPRIACAVRDEAIFVLNGSQSVLNAWHDGIDECHALGCYIKEKYFPMTHTIYRFIYRTFSSEYIIIIQLN